MIITKETDYAIVPDFALESRNDCVVRLCGICLYQQPFKSD